MRRERDSRSECAADRRVSLVKTIRFNIGSFSKATQSNLAARTKTDYDINLRWFRHFIDASKDASTGWTEMTSAPSKDLTPVTAAVDPFRPSEYTGLLMRVLKSRAHTFGRGKGLDMGMGSGVLLGMLGQLGVERLYGVDIDPDAVQATARLMKDLGLLDRTHLMHGSLWEPLGNEKFDVVVTNLPNFPATEPSDPDHSPFWSMGGDDGRRVLNPFLLGLRSHLLDNGVAFMTHNEFAGLAETEGVLASHGLSVRSIMTTTVILHPSKSSLLGPEIRARYMGVAMNQLGPYEFADVRVLEIRPARIT
jgi:release factor glutamine methyltransferase